MYTKSAALYDAIYSFKNYEAEANRVCELIDLRQRSRGRRLLDVGCGTGGHLVHLGKHFECEGVDLDPNLLAIAGAKCPGVPLHSGDMTDFDLGRTFDAVVCLFSAIGYVRTAARMHMAVANLARHLAPGGVLIVEPWLIPGSFEPQRLNAMIVNQPELKIVRMDKHRVAKGVSLIDLHYLVGTPDKIECFTERHKLGLFTREQYLRAFSDAGLETTWDEKGLIGRGLVIGVKSDA